MANNTKTPSANLPKQDPDEPLGDRGGGDKTWSPDSGEQGISNRVDDEAGEPERNAPEPGGDITGGGVDDEEFGDDDEEEEDEADEEDQSPGPV